MWFTATRTTALVAALILRTKWKALRRKSTALRTKWKGILLCGVGITAYYVLCLFPLVGAHPFDSGEILMQMQMVASATDEIRNHHILLRYANSFPIALNPLFESYSPLFYFAAGLISVVSGADAFNSILAAVGLFVAVGTFGLYAAGRSIGAARIPAASAAMALPFTPYFFTEVYVRTSFVETSFWCLFPWLIAALARFYDKPSANSALLLVVSTALLLLSHKILLGWAAVTLAVFSLVLFDWRRLLALLPSLCLIAITAGALVAPYLLNMLLNASHVPVASGVLSFSGLSSGLKPFALTGAPDDTLKPQYTYFSLGLGYVAMAGLLASLPLARGHRAIAALLVPFIISLCALSSLFGTVDLNNILPEYLKIIQFPYRMLVLCSVFALLLWAMVMTVHKRAIAIRVLFFVTLALQIPVFWYAPPLREPTTNELMPAAQKETSRHLATAYAERPVAYAPNEPFMEVHRSQVTVDENHASLTVELDQPKWVVLPLLYSRLDNVNVNGKAADIFEHLAEVALYLGPGLSRIDVRRDAPVNAVGGLVAAIVGLIALWYVLPITRRRLATPSTKVEHEPPES
jgi:hypothetical protein